MTRDEVIETMAATFTAATKLGKAEDALNEVASKLPEWEAVETLMKEHDKIKLQSMKAVEEFAKANPELGPIESADMTIEGIKLSEMSDEAKQEAIASVERYRDMTKDLFEQQLLAMPAAQA